MSSNASMQDIIANSVEEYIKQTRWLDLLIYIGNDYSLTANSCGFNRVTPNENKYFIRINVKK